MVLYASSHCNCHPDADPQGEKGTTIWGECAPISFHINPNQDYYEVGFTDTKPKCYSGGTHACLVIYDIQIDNNSSNDQVRINRYLNNNYAGTSVHSKIQGHDITEIIDLPPFGFYNDGELNKLKFVNTSDVGVSINNLRIVRAYGMLNLGDDCAGNCSDPADANPIGTLDWTREDYPCNYESCGTRYSFAHFGPDSSQGDTVGPGQSKTWTIENPGTTSPSNYVGPSTCFFNFNNIDIDTENGEPQGNDVHYIVKLNNNIVANFYHSKNEQQNQAAGVDLAKWPQYYNDAPGAQNTIELHNNDPDVSLKLIDGIDAQPPDPGRIDVYRFYRVANLCQDDFNDNDTDECLWDELEVNGGTANETNGQLRVTIPSGGDVIAQAGYVTKRAYDFKEMTTTVQVLDFNEVDEMILQIGNTKTTTGDPYFQNNWYRILKARYDSKVYVQNKIGGVVSNKAVLDWAGAVGTLTISVSTGAIALYENGILRYAEPFALPSYNCYVYIFTSTLRSRSYGTDWFNNFTINPTGEATSIAFKDNFNDGNYNGWSVDWGGWEVENGILQTTQVNSLISTNSSFQTNRHVESRIKTVTPGDENWQVVWLASKWINWDNQLYVLLKKNGYVELGIRYDGNQRGWEASTGKGPYRYHTIAITTIDDRALVWVDGTLYLDITNDWINNFSGKVAFNASMSTAEIDDVIVFDE